MPFEQIANNGGTMVTGQRSIALMRLLSIKGRLRMEMAGMRFRGGSTFKMVKNEFGFKGNKEKVFAAFTAHLESENARYEADRAVNPNI